MKVCVLGLWHLGTVTAACLASAGHDVVGLDFDPKTVGRLVHGQPPLFEPGLEALVQNGLANGRLRFIADAEEATRDADVLWVAYDTPVDDDDRADVEYVTSRVERVLPLLKTNALVLISSQLPVGTTRQLADRWASSSTGRQLRFAYSPENLRLGTAIEVFTHPDRIIAGVNAEGDRVTVDELLRPFTDRIEWMSVESAEMTKHALNAFLATSVAFINEIATLCEQVGADAGEVARGLKSEARIGPKAYLSPGDAFAGGTLARDIVFLSQVGSSRHIPTHVLSAVKASNDAHRRWAGNRLASLLGDLAGKTVAVWGLTYKAGTDTLRRSGAVELSQWLHKQGAQVRAYDPTVRDLPAELTTWLHLDESPLAATEHADALVVATPWPEYRQIAAQDLVARMARPLVLDANRFLGETLGRNPAVEYFSVGKTFSF